MNDTAPKLYKIESMDGSTYYTVAPSMEEAVAKYEKFHEGTAREHTLPRQITVYRSLIP